MNAVDMHCPLTAREMAATLRRIRPDRGNRYAPKAVRVKGQAAYAHWLETVEALAAELARLHFDFDRAAFREDCGANLSQ